VYKVRQQWLANSELAVYSTVKYKLLVSTMNNISQWFELEGIL